MQSYYARDELQLNKVRGTQGQSSLGQIFKISSVSTMVICSATSDVDQAC